MAQHHRLRALSVHCEDRSLRSVSHLRNTGNWKLAQLRAGQAGEGEDNLFPSGTNRSPGKGNDITWSKKGRRRAARVI